MRVTRADQVLGAGGRTIGLAIALPSRSWDRHRQTPQRAAVGPAATAGREPLGRDLAGVQAFALVTACRWLNVNSMRSGVGQPTPQPSATRRQAEVLK